MAVAVGLADESIHFLCREVKNSNTKKADAPKCLPFKVNFSSRVNTLSNPCVIYNCKQILVIIN